MRVPCALLPLIITAYACACEPETAPEPTVAVGPSARATDPRLAASDAKAATQAPADQVTARPAAPDAVKIAHRANAFGFDLYARARGMHGNLALSSSSAWLALAMAWSGAKGKTAAEMSHVLHLTDSPQVVAQDIAALGTRLQAPDAPYTLRMANRLFGEQNYRFEQPYLDLTQSAFGAALEPVDFRTGANAARTHINDWVAQSTANRIKDLIPPGAVGSDSRLVLVNAVYFLGEWATGFAKSATTNAPFYPAGSAVEQVPTMHQSATLRAGTADGVELVELPYRGRELAMTIVVPETKDGLAAVEQSLSVAKLEQWTSALHRTAVELSLPRFVIDPPESLSLSGALSSMGMPSAFDPAQADFTGMANPPDTQARIVFSDVFHKFFVAVDEKGTEAAAATAITLVEGAMVEPPPMTIKADRPFLFFIRDLGTGLVLFQGRVADPSATGGH